MSGSKFRVDDYFETDDDESTLASAKNLWRRYPLTIITTAIVVIFLTLSFGMMKGISGVPDYALFDSHPLAILPAIFLSTVLPFIAYTIDRHRNRP